jgi:hypothetical protein
MGYVEQFDTQSPQLTIRETVEFSAKMRLETDSTVTESITKFVAGIDARADESPRFAGWKRCRRSIVRTEEALSIAVEVAANRQYFS